MIEGHGDDAYRYEHIRSDFSSNICVHSTHQSLLHHLAAHPELISHYPEPEAWSLERMIAERHDIDPGQVIVTGGATEAIYLIAQVFKMQPVIPRPTFSEYEDACIMYSDAIAPGYAGNDRVGKMLWLCSPNNPTGEVYDQLYIDRMMAKYNLVVIDHSYENYTDLPVMSPRWGARTPYSIQIHSMTKTYGVPGLRLGYITAHENLTKVLRRNLRPWSVSALAIEAGKYLLGHDEFICKPDLKEAQRLYFMLQQTEGIVVTPTRTNFMLCWLAQHTAAELKEYLARCHGMLIRDASNFRGLTSKHFRVAAQTPAENDELIRAIQSFIALKGNG
ncbi:MAG: aminotransferase class I/II-fold pyridoxal phosphate-dependent enzyme [Prevotella sp.]|nr:aminotransferase class I/II-fold pyridoxal phosphate-dependent enzyme [Prevotella sp.]